MIEFEKGKRYCTNRYEIQIFKRFHNDFVRVKLYPFWYESWCPIIHFPETEVVEDFGIRFYANKETMKYETEKRQ